MLAAAILATQGNVQYHKVNLQKLRKLYKERTGSIGKRRGHAPSRWNKKQLIAALQRDDSARFDFFSVPPEIRNLIYEKMKEVLEETGGWHPFWRPTRYPDLKNMRLTCRRANAEVSGVLYSVVVPRIHICWQLGSGPRPGWYLYEHGSYHSVIEDNGDKAEETENSRSPILAYRKNPHLSGLKYIVNCKFYITVALVIGHSVYTHRELNEYLDERAERDFQRIFPKIIMEVKGLSKYMKSLEISWGRDGNKDRHLHSRMGDIVLRALSAVPGKVNLVTEEYWGPRAIRWNLSS